MKIEKRSKNTYRITKMYKGKKYFFNFAHKPTQRECLEAISAITTYASDSCDKGSFEYYAIKYIDAKENVLSPSTVRSYQKILVNVPSEFKKLQLSKITNDDFQRAINEYSLTHSPKTCRNMSGLVTTVMKMYRPSFNPNVTLPQKIPTEYYIPTADEVKQILEYAKGKSYEVPFYLGAMGLRRSEICGLTIDDLDGRILHIHSAVVQDKNNNYITKNTTKTYSSTRDIVISQQMADKIREQGYVYDKQPYMITRALHRAQKNLDIPEFRLHDMRHFFITEMFAAGVPEADIVHMVGHSTDYTTRRVYRHSRIDNDIKAKESIADRMSSIIGE